MADGAVVSNAPSPESVVNIGDCVEIAAERRIGVPDGEAGICFVTELNNDGSFNVRWAVENRGEKNILPSRIVCVNPLAVTADVLRVVILSARRFSLHPIGRNQDAILQLRLQLRAGWRHVKESRA